MRVVLVCFGFLLVTVSGFVQFKGINEAGAEFGMGQDGGSIGQVDVNYFYPTPSSVDYYVDKGMNIFRFPFRWERIQQSLNGPLDATELGRMNTFIDYVTNTKQAYLILDPHNYAKYHGAVIGRGSTTYAHFNDLWTKLANEYKDNSRIWFGLMNEPVMGAPNSDGTETWLTAANNAIAAIRATGATNLILVPGNGYTGAHSWEQNWYGNPNGDVMDGIVDSGNNYAIEVHQYFDSDYSGTSDFCQGGSGSAQLTTFTAWARTRGLKAFLGEWAGGANQACYTTIQDVVEYMDMNTDVWLGWTWWAGGPQWGDYIFSLEPNGSDRPQMQYLDLTVFSSDGTDGTDGTDGSTDSSTDGMDGSTDGTSNDGGQDGDGDDGSCAMGAQSWLFSFLE